jgi:hypothetical protein
MEVMCGSPVALAEVGLEVGPGVGLGDGLEVGSGAGLGVGLDVGSGVGLGVGLGVAVQM